MLIESRALGLVILEGSYGAAVQDEHTEGLEIDVTIPLQALVNGSQLYIPGRRSKVSCIYMSEGIFVKYMPGSVRVIVAILYLVRIAGRSVNPANHSALPAFLPRRWRTVCEQPCD